MKKLKTETNDNMNNFQKELKKFRHKKNLTSEEMSQKLGITLSAYYSYEQGLRMPKINKLKEISKTLKCTTDKLI